MTKQFELIYKAMFAADEAFSARGEQLHGKAWGDKRYSLSHADPILESLADAYQAAAKAYNLACIEQRAEVQS